jgi:hypothetical protein
MQVNARTGRVRVSETLDGAFFGFSGNGLIYSRRESPENNEVIEVWSLRVIEQ